MTNKKTATLTIRIEPSAKEKLKTAADREHRSIANMVEVLIRDYCVKNGIEICMKDELASTTIHDVNERIK